jgi:hypothetical protein
MRFATMDFVSRSDVERRDREIDGVLSWLLRGDPAVRWQVMRDLLGGTPDQVVLERARVATEGWGARLLGMQDSDGRWAAGLYSPKWTSTTYTLLLLQRLGLQPGNPHALAGCRQLWDSASWFDGGLNLAKTIQEPETCITGMLVLLAASFGHDDPRVDTVVEWLLAQQLDDGGWNCDSIRNGSTHGSFHTTITVLEALHAYDQHRGEIAVAAAMSVGRDFLLKHRLYRSHRTGDIVNPAFTRFPFPPQWHFDIVRGLEHFIAAGEPADDRLGDAIDEIRRTRRRDGTWPAFARYPGREWFRMEARGPSRWSTLRAQRILSWWDGQSDEDPQQGTTR